MSSVMGGEVKTSFLVGSMALCLVSRLARSDHLHLPHVWRVQLVLALFLRSPGALALVFERLLDEGRGLSLACLEVDGCSVLVMAEGETMAVPVLSHPRVEAGEVHSMLSRNPGTPQSQRSAITRTASAWRSAGRRLLPNRASVCVDTNVK